MDREEQEKGAREAFAAYQDLAEKSAWDSWSDLFTEDALYEEHWLGTFRGREAIREWIVALGVDNRCSVWIEWVMFDGKHVCVYAWNNFPDPTNTGRRFVVPSSSLLEYAGDGKFSWEGDYYDGVETERLIAEWKSLGGGPHMGRDFGLRGRDDWAPRPSEEVFPRAEIAEAFRAFSRCRVAAARGSRQGGWLSSLGEDAVYRNHRLGRVEGRDGARALADGMLTSPEIRSVHEKLHMIDGNRVSALFHIVTGDSREEEPAAPGFDLNTILHYAGGGKWSYVEDIYNPAEAEASYNKSR